MDVEKVLDELREQRDRIDEAILVLERLARIIDPRPGRPRNVVTGIATRRRNRPPAGGNKAGSETGGKPAAT